MWLPLVFFIVAGAFAAEHEHGWRVGQEYNYLVRSRTLTGLDNLANQFTGILIKGHLTVQPRDTETLRGKVSKTQYANLHKELPEGWESEISDRHLEIRDLPMSGKPFELKMKHGVIRDLIVDKEVPTWEVNILKSIVGQLQVDTQGENAIRSRSTQVPEENSPYAMFKAMEDSVGGKCEVLYDITPLPEDVLRNKPELVPIPKLKGDGDHIDIIKTKNFSRCEQRMDYHFGITGETNWEPGSNDNGRFFSKFSTSRIVISGNLNRFTIQSAVTTNKMFVSPRMYDHRSGVVVSKMNLTLVNVDKASERIDSPRNPESTGNLVYTYNNPFSESTQRRPGRPSISRNSREETDSGSRSAFSSDEERRSDGRRKSNSEEQDFWQPKPTLEEAPQNPLLPYFIGNKGKSVSLKIDPTEATKKLVNDISNELDDPSSIPKEETLEKYTILTKLMRTMSRRQMKDVSSDMHLSENDLKSGEESHLRKQNAWAVFRDAVTEAGTGPALLTIKDWIENKMIDSSEGAEVLSRLAKTARTPTPEYIDEFFKLASNPEVLKDDLLANAAVISFAELVHQSQINSRSSHNRYPVHSFGRIDSKHNEAVVQHYLPFFETQLKKAIRDEDRRKAQLFIVALGYMAHPKMLAIYEPYLEGKEPSSVLQRAIMVGSLSKLAQLHPKLARYVLYKIYLNRMEAHDVRCMAVFLLMNTNPPLSMLQRMAEFTNYDTNKHVNSAVKSMIENFATSNLPEHKDMSTKALIAKKLLNPEEYSYGYSQAYMSNDILKNKNLSYRLLMSYISSEDSPFPRAAYAGLGTSYGDFKAPTAYLSYMLSSFKSLHNRKNDEERSDESISEKIVKMLGIEPDEAVPLEGHIMWDNKYGTRLFTFDKETIRNAPRAITEKIEEISKRGYINANSITDYEVILSFPTETGLPFVYTLRIPTLVRTSVKNAEVRVGDDGTWNIKGDVRVVYSKKVQGRIGFVAPFEHQHYLSGIDMNFQVYVPIKFSVETSLTNPKKSLELKLWLMKDEKNARLLHYSIIPYTSRHDILSLQPVLTDKNTQKVHTAEPETLNESLPTKGVKALRVNAEADNLANDLIPDFDDMEFEEMILFPWSQHDDKYRKVDIYVNLEKEHKIPVTLKFVYDTMETTEGSGEWTPKSKAVMPVDNEADSEDRRKQFMKEVMKGMNSAQASVLDIKLEMPGMFRNRNVVTAAWAGSKTEDKARALLFWHLDFPDQDIKFEVCGTNQMKSNMDGILDYEAASRTKPKYEMDMDIKYGRSCSEGGHMRALVKMQQSDEMREKVEQYSVVKKCKEQMKNGNKLLKACRDAVNARAITDEISLSMEMQMKTVHALINKGLTMVEDLVDGIDVDIDTSNPKNAGKDRIDVNLKIATDLKSANMEVHTPQMDVTFSDINIEDEETETGKKDDEGPEAFLNEVDFESTCTIDNNEAETFDRKTYSLKLGKCWHVVMVTSPKKLQGKSEKEPLPDWMKISVLARETEDGKEMKLILGDREIRFKSGGIEMKVSVNGQKIRFSKDTTYQEKKDGETLFEIYELLDGSVKLMSEKHNLNIVFDGKRILIEAAEKYRKEVRGLCGNFDRDPQNDFMTPKNCVLKSPEEFVSTYALLGEGCEGPSVENAKKAEKSVCRGQSLRLSNVISDIEAGRTHKNRNWGYHSENRAKEDSECNIYRTKVLSKDDKICFSIRPVPVCAAGCTTAQRVPKNYQFHCMDRNQAAIQLMNRVEKGANPDLSQKPVSLTETINVDIQCVV